MFHLANIQEVTKLCWRRTLTPSIGHSVCQDIFCSEYVSKKLFLAKKEEIESLQALGRTAMSIFYHFYVH